MQSNGIRAMGYGAVAGALFGLGALALFGPLTAIGSIDSAPLGTQGGVTITITQGAFFLASIVSGLAGGALIATAGYAVGTRGESSSERYPARYVAAIGALLGAVLGFALTRGLLALAGDTTYGGTITLPILKMTLIVVIVGTALGGMIAMVADHLSYPRAIGFSGAAVPLSRSRFLRETGQAIGRPILVGTTIAGLAFGFSRLLLASTETGAVVLFGIVGALVLGSAALLAARPWESGK